MKKPNDAQHFQDWLLFRQISKIEGEAQLRKLYKEYKKSKRDARRD